MERAGRRPKRKSRRTITGKVGPNEGLRTGLDPRLSALFEEFADRSFEFSREIAAQTTGPGAANGGDNALLNLRVARTVFGKWSVEILTFLYSKHESRFQELKNALGDISARVLSLKLTRLEDLGFVHRAVLDTRPPSVQYSLTEKGRQLAKLGEPVFLYLRLTEGLMRPVNP
jgi:DNA-binding HxlR family transcriptional regulator